MREKQLKFFYSQEDKNKKIVTIPKDILYFSLIIVTLSICLAYIAGVSRGRKIAKKSYFSSPKDIVLVKNKLEKKKGKSLSASKEISKTTKRKNKTEYVIQVATYKNKKLAEEEKERLKKKGFPVILSRKGKYLVIFVGKFSTKEEAKQKLNFLKARYKDCFIRRL